MNITEERIQAVEKAYALMKSNGWGFASNGHGFGDPAATYTLVGPIRNGLVEVYGQDKDCVVAVQKAVDKSKAI